MPTNWAQHDLDSILKMFMSVDTGSLNKLAETWRTQGEAIGRGRETLVAQTGALAGHWKGKAATAFTDSATQSAARMEQWRVQTAVRAAGIDMAAMKITSAQQSLTTLKAQRDQALAEIAQQREGLGVLLGGQLTHQENAIRASYDKWARLVAEDAATEILRLAVWESPGPYVGLHDVKPVAPVPYSGAASPSGPPGTGGPNSTTAAPDQRQPTATTPDGLHQLDLTQVQTTDPRQDSGPQTGPQENNVNQSPEQQVAPPETTNPPAEQPPTLGQPPGTGVPTPPGLPDVPGAPVVPPIVPIVPGGVGAGSRGLGPGGLGGGSGGAGSGGVGAGGVGAGGIGAGRSGAGAPTVSTDLLGRLAGTEGGGGGGLLAGVRPTAGAGAGTPMIPPMVPPVAPPGGNGGALTGRQTRRTTRGGGAPRVIGQEPVTAPQSISGRPADRRKAPPPRQQETEQPAAVTHSV